jgi:hypothetical protein
MGWNTTIVVMNDSLHTIAKDKNFGKKLEQAILSVSHGKTVDVSAQDGQSISCNAATVIETHHADTKVLVAVGGNMGEVVTGYAGSYDADNLNMLRRFAEDMGYSIRKKPVPIKQGAFKKENRK